MIIKEIQKRPFIRPLLIWITGILLQAYLDCRILSLLLILIPLLIILLSHIAAISGPDKNYWSYEFRWLWGAAFLLLLLSFSIQQTAYWQGTGKGWGRM